jgi:hypothetical protein
MKTPMMKIIKKTMLILATAHLGHSITVEVVKYVWGW